MNKQQTLQNIWAMTDKAVIDIMTKKTCKSSSTLSPNESEDDNSDLESIDSRYGPFAAVPKEFRPSLTVRTKYEHPRMSLNENKQILSNQNPVSTSKLSAAKSVHEVPSNTKPPLFTHSRPSLPNPKPPLPRNPKASLLNSRPSLLPTPKPASMEWGKMSNRNEASVSKKDINHLQHPRSVKNYYQVANNTTTTQKTTDVKNNSGVSERTVLQPPKKIADNSLQKRNEALSMKTAKHKNGKKEIKYEYVGIQEHRTVKLNFEMPPISNLQEQKKGKEEIMKKLNKNFRDGTERKFNKDAPTVLSQENTVKWVSSWNSEEENSDIEGKTERVFGKVTHRVLHQENIVKWDSSLNLKNSSCDGKGKIERGFGKNEGRIKWHGSLNLEESSSDSESEIKWTVIQEQKTIISANKIDSKDYTYKQANAKSLPTKPCIQKGPQSKKYARKKYFNRNAKQSKNYHGKNTPKLDRKDTENLVYKNDFQVNNHLKDNHNEIRHSNTQDKCNLDAETFTRQCRFSEKNLDNSNVSPTFTNYKPQFTMHDNARKTIDNCESNSCSEKIDNITLKRIEEQKESMLNYGREVSDLIIGSYSALSIFMSMFNEWKQARLELISHFQHLEKNLNESSKKFTKYQDMLDMAKTGVAIAAAVPLPHVSIAARVISIFTSLFSVFLSSTEKKRAEVEDSNDITVAAAKDTSASSDVYMYGLLCGQNFEDTAKLIEEFHSNVANLEREIFEKDSPEIATFIRGVLEYRPRHRIFFKKLHRCFQELIQNCSSEFGKRFCEPYLLYSSRTIDVIEFLDWRFLHEDFNGESVRFELEQIDYLIQGNDTSIKELTVRIQTCIGILQEELKFFERRLKDFNLFDKPVKF